MWADIKFCIVLLLLNLVADIETLCNLTIKKITNLTQEDYVIILCQTHVKKLPISKELIFKLYYKNKKKTDEESD